MRSMMSNICCVCVNTNTLLKNKKENKKREALRQLIIFGEEDILGRHRTLVSQKQTAGSHMYYNQTTRSFPPKKTLNKYKIYLLMSLLVPEIQYPIQDNQLPRAPWVAIISSSLPLGSFQKIWVIANFT